MIDRHTHTHTDR